MLLAVAAALALAAPGPRMPGLTLRFGEALAAVDTMRGWRADPKPPAGATVRVGEARFFGVPADVKLFFTDSLLARAEAVVDSISPRDQDYVLDELRRRGMRRVCDVDEPDHRRCSWTGRGRVTLDIARSRVKATIESAPAPAPTPPPAPPVAAASPFDGAPPQFDLEHPDSTAPWPAPEVAQRATPAYPARARQAGVMGRVRVLASVDSTGAVIAAEIAKGVPLLDAAALDCVKRWRFKPYAPGGRALAYRVVVPVLFVLD